MIAEITASDVIRSSGTITPGGKHHSFLNLDVGSLEVPASSEWCNKEITKPASTADGGEIGDTRILGLNIRYERAAGGRKYQIHSDVSVQNVEVRYVVEEVFDCPNVVVARNRNGGATWAIECAGTVVDSHVDVAKARGRYYPCIQSNLAWNPLRLLLG